MKKRSPNPARARSILAVQMSLNSIFRIVLVEFSRAWKQKKLLAHLCFVLQCYRSTLRCHERV